MCNMFPFIGKVLHTIKGFRPASPAPGALEKEWWVVDGFTNVNHTFLCSYMAFSHHDFIRQFKTKSTRILLGYTIRDPLDRERLS